MKNIETKRLLLRSLEVVDITLEYVSALNDTDVTLFTEARHAVWDLAAVQKYVSTSSPKNSELIGIFLKESGRHIGNIRLSNFNEFHKRVELGIMIFAKDRWGRGFGTEALFAIEDYVFGELRFHKLCADYYATNTRSAKMFEGAGYIIEGVFRDHFFLNNTFVESVRIAKFNTRS